MEKRPLGHLDIASDQEREEPCFHRESSGALGQGPAQLGPICGVEMSGEAPLAQTKGFDGEDGDRGTDARWDQGTTMTGTGEWWQSRSATLPSITRSASPAPLLPITIKPASRSSATAMRRDVGSPSSSTVS